MMYLESFLGLPKQSIISIVCSSHHLVLSIQSVVCIINLLFKVFQYRNYIFRHHLSSIFQRYQSIMGYLNIFIYQFDGIIKR